MRRMPRSRLPRRIGAAILRQDPRHIYTVELTGSHPDAAGWDLERIEEQLRAQEYCCQLIDNTRPAYQLEQLYRENRGNLLGDFIEAFQGRELTELEQRALELGIETLRASGPCSKGGGALMEKLELIRLELNGFGRFRGQTFELQGGLNLIEGANEAGKSTLQAFIGGMFYGFFPAREPSGAATPPCRNATAPGTAAATTGCWSVARGNGPTASSGTLTRTPSGSGFFDRQTGEDLTDSFPL